MRGGLTQVLEAFQLAGRTSVVIRGNLFLSFLYNTAGIAFAVTGALNPIIAAGAMVVSSLSVVANVYRSNRHRVGIGSNASRFPQPMAQRPRNSRMSRPKVTVIGPRGS